MSKKLDSGANIEITLAPFTEGHRLFKTVARELEDLNFKEDTIQKMALKLISSEAVEIALWRCMERASYNKMKVNADLFENSEIRKDFFPVAKEVLIFNLTPFFANLASLFPVSVKDNTENQK